MSRPRALCLVLFALLVPGGTVQAQLGQDPPGTGSSSDTSGGSAKKKPAVAQKAPDKSSDKASDKADDKKAAEPKKGDTKTSDGKKPDAMPAEAGSTSAAGAKPPSTAGTASSAAPGPAGVPPPEVLLMLVRTTLVALNQANYTNNYAVLHGLGTSALKERNTADKLGEAFKALRESKVDLSPVLVLTPQLTEPPALSPQGIMTLKGFFPTKPLQVNFAMAFQPVEGRWLIDGLAVAAVPTGPQAAAQPPATAPAPAPGAADKKP